MLLPSASLLPVAILKTSEGIAPALRTSSAQAIFLGWAFWAPSPIAVTARGLAGPCSWRRFTGETPVDGAKRTWLLPRKPASTLLRRGHTKRGPGAKHSVVGNGSIAASLGFLVPIVHDLAFTRALVQVAEFSHPDEREAGAATRAPYFRRERVKPHWTLWRHFIPSPLTSRCMPRTISTTTSPRSGSGSG